jgi:hypothetical protein
MAVIVHSTTFNINPPITNVIEVRSVASDIKHEDGQISTAYLSYSLNIKKSRRLEASGASC